MKGSLYVSLLIIVATIFMILAVYFDWVQLHILVGPYFIHHWLSWIGATFIAVYTPIYYWMKRKYPTKTVNLLRLHNIGNLISVLFISIHFTQQISRPAQFYPDLATGVVLYPTIILLAGTGLIMRFTRVKNKNNLRFIHKAITLTFYFTILIHILHGIGII